MTKIHFKPRSHSRQVAFALGVMGVYALTFIPLYHQMGAIVAALAGIPVLVAGWLLGLRAGLLAGLFSILLNTLLFNLAGESGWDVAISDGRMAGVAIVVLIGLVVGRLGDLAEQLQREIIERRQVEAALQESEEKFRKISASAQDAIVMIDNEGNASFWNEAAEKMFGYLAQEVLGQELHTLIVPQRYYKVYRLALGGFKTTGQGAAIGKTLELAALKKDGTEFPVELSLSAVKLGDTWNGIGIIRDITERVRAEEQIKAALTEKEVLLQEIHHRVKNNLQVISSLLNLQSSYVEDPYTLEIFQESQHRIRSMALIHEKLYQAPDLARVDLGEYIQSLAAYLFRSYRAAAGGVSLKIQTDDVSLGIDAAVPCGLILNELVSNSLKYAFPASPPSVPPNGRTGPPSAPPSGGEKKGGSEICIELRANGDGQVTLRVSDNGVGFPAETDFQNTTSLGLQLVNTLVNQLNGAVELDGSAGTEFKIMFTVP